MKLNDIADGIIRHTIGLEGAYSDNKDDLGGKTNFGITEKVARAEGYTGEMKDFTYEMAYIIYMRNYYCQMKIDKIAEKSYKLACKVFDFGVNSGNSRSIKTLQEAINMCSVGSPLIIDGLIGKGTLRQLGKIDSDRINLVFEANKIARYIEITKAREKNETFIVGWLDNRTDLER